MKMLAVTLVCCLALMTFSVTSVRGGKWMANKKRDDGADTDADESNVLDLKGVEDLTPRDAEKTDSKRGSWWGNSKSTTKTKETYKKKTNKNKTKETYKKKTKTKNNC
ncbi:uncharacterized protein LOC143276436 [Babylonia areolata]|uniref:uncharacterized protein LOC143276436 n=1 Tax=Babylonia areolata TaxID=304850 RepID=UPI003FCF5F19